MSDLRLYFAARYSRHDELAGYRDELLAAVPGTRVTSRWIDCHDGELESSYTPEALAADPAGCWKHGQADLEDLAEADAIVSFTGDGGGGKGGRHIEHGIAISYVDNGPWLNLGTRAEFRLILIGPRENIFHCHPATEHYDTWPEFLAALMVSRDGFSGPYTRARDEFWGRTYHLRIKAGSGKEHARRYACWETLKIYGTTPFAKKGDPQP